MTEMLILVDKNDTPVGVEEKLKTHLQGLRHRAFSIFIFNSRGEILIQRRALGKYHSAGLWANACCGHPRLAEENKEAAQRRLQEELGFVCPLNEVSTVCYTLKLENGLHENEFTHVFQGIYEGEIRPAPEEVMEIAWVNPKDLLEDITRQGEAYARWFRLYALKHFEPLFIPVLL